MKGICILILLVVSFTTMLFSQSGSEYSSLIKEANQFYENQEYLKAAKKYSDAFALNTHSDGVDRYNAACSWALVNETDSAFFQLFVLAKKGDHSMLEHIGVDRDLTSLHSDERWGEVIMLLNNNKMRAEEKLDKSLVILLDSIFQEDQSYRLQADEIAKTDGRTSEAFKSIWKTINEKDSLNQIIVQKILDERGWLGSDVIGDKGAQTLFLVIQHADISIQEKYLPMMREAVNKGNANPANLALLEDRVALRQGKKQVYGSQIWIDNETGKPYVAPLEDPDKVDERRSAVGLGAFQDYLSLFGIIWDVETYKKNHLK